MICKRMPHTSLQAAIRSLKRPDRLEMLNALGLPNISILILGDFYLF